MRTLVYFQDADTNEYTSLDIDNLTFVTDRTQWFKSKKFEIMKGYTATEGGLLQFATDFKQWCTELQQFDIDYTRYFNHFCATTLTFMRYGKRQYEQHEPISSQEYKWIEKCHSGGLNYYHENGEFDCFAYDYPSFYPTLMNGTMLIPFQQGMEYTLESLPDQRLAGYYRVLIHSDHPDITKLFTFSKHNTYTHQSLSHAFHLQKTYPITIELIQDGQPNAYLYQPDQMIRCKEVFGNWYKALSKIKAKHPKNRLVKRLMSSLWGSLSKRNGRWLTVPQLDDIDMDKHEIIEWKIRQNDEMLFKIMPTSQPYKYNIRLKPFLTACGRAKIAGTIAQYPLHNIQSIMTDGVIYKHEDPHITKKTIHPDDKYSGRVNWTGHNRGTKLSDI